ncbi:DUF2012 domain-containing protein [Mycena kentingensis (nom. inval.)]|nr:DUF2012 domain-containing protein [Mycena kentingensis (nom. inval.)]
MTIRQVFALLSFVLSALAVDILGQIRFNDFCENIQALGPAKVILDNGRFSGDVLFDGSFRIYNVSEGVYVLSVVSHDHVFDQLRIDVAESNYQVRPYALGTPLNPPSTIILSEISLPARATHAYYMPPQSFNLMGMLGSPMVLMLIVGGGMVFLMPYLMQNMDPETMKEFREQQAKYSGMQNAFATGDLKGGFSALMAEEEPKAAAAPPAAKGRSGAKGKRR